MSGMFGIDSEWAWYSPIWNALIQVQDNLSSNGATYVSMGCKPYEKKHYNYIAHIGI